MVGKSNKREPAERNGKPRRASAKSARARRLAEHALTEEEARRIRGRLAAFDELWDDPEMDVYDRL